jgi:hypothetical protein
MSFILNHSVVTKKIIDLLVDFIRKESRKSRLYQQTQVSDRFSLEAARIPSIIVKNVSNTQRRIHYDDFIQDIYGRVQLIPIQADDDLVGNNLQRTNLPDTLDYDPRWALDPTIGYPTGTDITQAIFTSGTGVNFNSGVTTGIIITLPPPNTYDPSSLIYALEAPREDGTPNPITPSGTGIHTIGVAISAAQDQFYLIYSGTSITGTVIQAVEPDQYIVNASGLVPGLTGTVIKLNDVLWAGDQYQVQTYYQDQMTYATYGGIYEMSIQFECYAGSTIEAQELGDLVERFLVEKKKKPYDSAGFNFTSWAQGGQGEEDYINDHIFSTSVSCDGFIFWTDYRSVDIITSASGTAIPSGTYPIYPYMAPSVYTNLAFTNPVVPNVLNITPQINI